jgi:hypothetical protein
MPNEVEVIIWTCQKKEKKNITFRMTLKRLYENYNYSITHGVGVFEVRNWRRYI